MACETLLKELEKADRAHDIADLAVSAAEHAVNSAELTYGLALAAEVACAFTIETVIGFLACEAAAVAAAEAALEALRGAEEALQVAEEQAQDAEDAEKAARDDYCECMNSSH